MKAAPVGRSTNGRSSAFGALCLGSNPSRPASFPAQSGRRFRDRLLSRQSIPWLDNQAEQPKQTSLGGSCEGGTTVMTAPASQQEAASVDPGASGSQSGKVKTGGRTQAPWAVERRQALQDLCRFGQPQTGRGYLYPCRCAAGREQAAALRRWRDLFSAARERPRRGCLCRAADLLSRWISTWWSC